ncbi:DinB family protein [Helicobacter sp. MIT 14-3879]|uniref:DinB family protein n=1 Tax=Helicobacter sp. MIT 14-3879 TaxID=2040649 RepID=UPI000E1F183C|nr:DinB family protein [Helicobacter sp. MIT 14-3879]RDU61399.1 damage-inducible protein DinB [Helicobacter sp. MIT 14-3879]
MQEALLLQAKYNQFANNNMFHVLKKLDRQSLEQTYSCLYFGTILKTLKHNISANIGIFLKEFSVYATNKPANLNRLLEYKNLEIEKESIESIESISAQIDTAMIEIIENINNFHQVETLSFPNVAFKKSRAQMLLAILNHSIHHRGQIAAALDSIKIENDFAGMLSM